MNRTASIASTASTAASPDFSLLSANMFEGLCFALFRALNYQLFLSTGARQRYGDFEGVSPVQEGAKPVLIEVRHRDKFDPISLRQFCLRAADINASQLIYVTSARIPSRFLASLPEGWVPEGKSMKLVGREDLHQMLVRNPSIQEQYFGPAKRQARLSKLKISVGVALLAVSATWAVHNRNGATQSTRATLPDQIAAVQQSLDSIRNLQGNLEDLQKNLNAMSAESRRIEDEYAKARELKKLTSVQLDEVKEALSQSSTEDNLKTGGIGLALGIAGSLMASWLWDKWVRWRERASSKE